MQTNKIHYHVLAGFHGCLPESNNGPFTTLKESRAELKEEISELRDSGNTLVGDLKHGYFELSKKTTALCDYVSIEECVESDCFIDDPEDLLAKDLSKDDMQDMLDKFEHKRIEDQKTEMIYLAPKQSNEIYYDSDPWECSLCHITVHISYLAHMKADHAEVELK